jgi:hypothetical protein
MAKISKFKVNVGSKSKIAIEWKDKPENYSQEAKKHIISIVSDRYGISKEAIKVNFIPQRLNDKGEVVDISTDVITNIQDPKFQVKLFSDYISENNIENIDFEFIKKIDSEINSKIDYDVYDKYRKYEIEWISWDNFLSYGPENYFDFRTLEGLTLVNGEPANQSGKSSFTIDLISFLLFGKTQKPYTLAEVMNKFSEEKFFKVCGGIKIEGISYVIERTITRSKKKTGEWGDSSQEVKYYQIENGDKEELEEYDKNQAGEHSIKTNKIIKEAIGSEKDFNMIISATGNDLDSLIDVGNTERGRLLSKWIGLFPLEEKEKIGKERYRDFEKDLKSKTYNETDLTNSNETLKLEIVELQKSEEIVTNRTNELGLLIEKEQQEKETLLLSKKKIDENILKLDINTVNIKMKDIENEAKLKKEQLVQKQQEYELVKDANFNNEDYKALLELDKNLSIKSNELKTKIYTLNSTNETLLKNESCPTCHRKYDNVDNSGIIKQNEVEIAKLIESGIKNKEEIDKNKEAILTSENNKTKYDSKLKLQSLVEILPVQIENLRNTYRDHKKSLEDYEQSKKDIDLNNQIEISLTNVNAKMNAFKIEKESKIKENEQLKRAIKDKSDAIEKNKILIAEVKEEMKKIRNWKVYLEMIGKNGISKTVLRKTLPIINSELSRILDEVCDFEVEVFLTDKNEVVFKIIKDGVSSNLAGGSGFERTASALALRCVLGNISTMPRPNFITLDEILGKVAKENYDNMKNMYNKIQGSYQFILHISHIEDIKDWHKNIITVTKKSNLSSIVATKNINNQY